MTINTITTPLSGYESRKLEQLEQQRQEVQKAATTHESGTDRISISEEGRLKANILKAAQENEGIRPEKVADVKARIEAGEYKPNGKDIAAALVKQELDVWG